MDVVTVALVGDADTGLINEAEWERGWEDRQKLELEVEDDESLASLLGRALEAFGAPLPDYARSYAAAYPFVGFHQDEARPRVSSSVDVVDDRGRVVWNVYDFDAIPFSQLQRSAEAGTIAGDPRRVYAVLQPPSGNGVLIDWPTLLEGWRVATDVMEYLATIAGVAGGVEMARRVVRKLRRAGDSVDRNRSAWTQRGGRPPDLTRTVLGGEWTPESLARVLGCSDEDALALLEVFGFSSSGETWSLSDGHESVFLTGLRDELEYAYHMRYEAFEPLLRERLEFFARSGKRMDEEAPEYEFERPTLEVTAFGYADQVLTYQARVGERLIGAQVPLWETEEANDLIQMADRVVRSELSRLGREAKPEEYNETDGGR